MAPGWRSRRSPGILEQPDLDALWRQGVEEMLAQITFQQEGDQTQPPVPAGGFALQMGLKGSAENR